MREENNIEMSTIDDLIPRYYKGFDMDVIIQKILNGEPLSKEEDEISNEAYDVYYTKYFDENRERWQQCKENHPGRYKKTIMPNVTKQRKT